MTVGRSEQRQSVVLLVGHGLALPLWRIDLRRPPDLALAEALAHLQLCARRAGMSIRLHHPSPALSELLALAGLTDVVPEVGRSVDPQGGADMFVQVINGRTSDPAALRGRLEVWGAELKPGAGGYLGTTAGVSADGSFVAVVRFESEDAARANSERPEQGAWWAATEGYFEGPVTFHDCREVTILAAGGSDDAGFVQVVQGRAADKALVNRLEVEIHDWFPELRPDFIGSLLVWDGDWFTDVAYFTSEEEAREGERRLATSDRAGEFQVWLDAISEVTYIDLSDPWLMT